MSDLQRITGAVKLNIDEFEFSLDPNSYAYKDGNPTRAAKGTAGDIYFSEDWSEAFGMQKVSMPNTKANDDSIRQLRKRYRVKTTAAEVGGTFSKVQKQGVLVNDDESTTGTDGMLEITIVGTRLE